MGAGQSSSASDDRGAHTSQLKISYYDLLAIDRSATEDEIKKAYRRKALELHPDRNYGNVEQSTALFAQVQSAYEVLADPQERAWYDSHEHAILRDIDPAAAGSDATANEQSLGLTSANDIMRMFRKFNGNVEFSDAPSGFFGFLRGTFDQLAEEERSAAAREGGDLPEYPSFGHEADNHDKIKKFYGIWTAFSTRKSFAWRDRYRVSDAEDRWTRRRMEKENKAFRLEGKQEFNEAVRALVAFVKKRDPRYSNNVQSEEQRQATLREAAQAQAARMRAANQAQLQQEVPEWTRSREPDEELPSTEEESEEEHFECVACRKTFKSENQYSTHEKSKKHQKAVFALRKKLKKEGISLDLDSDEHEKAHEVIDKELDGVSPDNPISDIKPDSFSEVDCDQPQVESVEQSLLGTTAKLSLSDAEKDLSEHDSQGIGLGHATPSENEESDGKSQEDSQQAAVTITDREESSKAFSSAPKLGKAAQKRAKRAAKQASQDKGLEDPHKCVGCGTAFSSKGKLFQHLKDHPRHVAAKSEVHEGLQQSKKK